jgi:hypothetical protein
MASLFIILFSFPVWAGCGGLFGKDLELCEKGSQEMMVRLLKQRNESLQQDRDRIIIFHSTAGKDIQATVGELLDLSSTNVDWVFVYGQMTRNQESNGIANAFDISAICRKFPTINGVLKDDNVQFTCKNKMINGAVKYNPADDKTFFEVVKVNRGVVLSRTRSRNGKVFWTKKYRSPTWFVEEEFNDSGLSQSRQEWKNGKANGLHFSKQDGLRTEYKNGKVVRTFSVPKARK